MAKVFVLSPLNQKNNTNSSLTLAWFYSEVRRLYDLNHKLVILKHNSLEELPKLPSSIEIKQSSRSVLFLSSIIDSLMKFKPEIVYCPMLKFKNVLVGKMFLHALDGLSQIFGFKIVFGVLTPQALKENSLNKLHIVKNTIFFDESDSITQRDLNLAIDLSWIKIDQSELNNEQKIHWLVVNDLSVNLWQDLVDWSKKTYAERKLKPTITFIKPSGEWTSIERRQFISSRLNNTKDLSLVLSEENSAEKILTLVLHSQKIIYDPRSPLSEDAQIIIAIALKYKKQIYPEGIILQNENQTDRLYHQLFSN